MLKTVILFLTFFSTLALGQSKDVYQKIGDSLLTNGKSDELIKYFENELKKYPKNEEVLRWLGYIHISKINLDQGEKYYSEALIVNPKCARCYLNLGRIYSLKNENNKANEYFNKAIETDPNDGLSYATRAKFKELTDDTFGALFDYNKAIEIEPKNADYYIQRGIYNSNQGYFSLALSDINKAVEFAPKNYNPYFQRANIYYNQKKFNEALADISTAIRLDSNQYSLYTGRGAIYSVFKEHSKAIEDYSKAIALNPKDYLSYYNRGLEKYALEDMDACCSDNEIVLKLIKGNNIDDPDLLKECQLTFNEICDATKPSYFYQRGVAMYNLRQYPNAVDIYLKGLNLFPKNAMILSFSGNAYLALGEFKSALEKYFLAIENKENLLEEINKNPRFTGASKEKINSFYKGSLASVQMSIAECKFALGLYSEALTEINKGIELAEEVKESINGFGKESYYNVRGNIFLALGNYEYAKNDFDKCILLNPDFSAAYVNRAVAKTNLENQIKMTSYTVQGGINNEAFNANWKFPIKAKVKKSDSNIISALNDYDKAITIDSKSAYAYYIRGQIKKMLNYNDYCYDLLKANELGYPIEAELLKKCK